MDRLEQLFEKHRVGILSEEEIGELERGLMKVYLFGGDDLPGDMQAFARDLLAENYVKGALDEGSQLAIQRQLESDRALRDRVLLTGNLEAAFSGESGRRTQVTDLATAGKEKEEEELRSILREVMEKLKVEEKKEEKSTDKLPVIGGILQRIKEKWGSAVALRPSLQWVAISMIALVLVSVGIFWLFNQSGGQPGNPQLAGADSLNTGQGSDTAIRLANKEAVPEFARKDAVILLADAFVPEACFEFALTRGETTDCYDSLVGAANLYNDRKYGGSLRLLDQLAEQKCFKDPDTLCLIQYYRGNCYLLKGMKTGQFRKFSAALDCFYSIGSDCKYYNRSRWYTALALTQLGKHAEAVRVCDSLLDRNYTRFGEVKELKAKLQRAMNPATP